MIMWNVETILHRQTVQVHEEMGADYRCEARKRSSLG